MPAIDQCEPQVIRALQKAGWQVTHRPYHIRLDPGFLMADLRVRRIEGEDEAIIVEVKCFPANRSELDEFYHAVGQYLVYRAALQIRKSQMSVFLSVPQQTIASIFQRPSVQKVIQDARINIMVVDLEKEVIAQWIIW